MEIIGRVKIPKSLRKEIEISYLDVIVSTIQENNIPTSLVMKLDLIWTKEKQNDFNSFKISTYMWVKW